MDFEVIEEIRRIEIIAVNTSIHDLARLKKMYGKGRWRKLKGIACVRLRSGRVRLAELHWYEAHGYRQTRDKEKAVPGLMRKKKVQTMFVACIDNSGYRASLELHKIYRVIPDTDAAKDGDIRVVDESGEDYLYSADRFVAVEVPKALERSILKAS